MLALISVRAGAGFGGIQVVNGLLLDAARGAGLRGDVVSLHDRPGASWLADWPGSVAAGGSRPRFVAAALARRAAARGSTIAVTHVGLIPVGRLAKRLHGGRLVALLHGVEAWRAHRGAVAWGLAGCDRLVAVSRHTLERFRALNPALAGLPGEVCHLPARPLPDAAPAAPPEGGGPRVVIVGRLWGRGLDKGQRTLVELWPRLRAELPGAELVVVGEGDGRAPLEARCRELGMAGAIRFTGEIPDAELAALYQGADLYAMPSRGEGFGLVFAEAMARGLPCLASREDAGAEVVVDGETGLVVDPGRPDEILAALRRLLGDAPLRRRLGAAGRARAERLFSLAAFNARISGILGE